MNSRIQNHMKSLLSSVVSVIMYIQMYMMIFFFISKNHIFLYNNGYECLYFEIDLFKYGKINLHL